MLILNFLFAVIVFGGVFIILYFCTYKGRKYGLKVIARHPDNKLEVLTVAESAVFALLGLLIAFTFSGAYDRFELRKVQIIEEGNALETAYLRLDLLAPATQPAMRDIFHRYVDSRIAIYQALPMFRVAMREWKNSLKLRSQIWDAAVAACKTTGDSTLTQLILPPLNDMFDIANTRYASTRVHSPPIVFILLIGLAGLSSYLAGFATAKNKVYNPIYILSYVAITAFTIYIVIDLEFPLVGLIRIDAFNQVLVDVKKEMN